MGYVVCMGEKRNAYEALVGTHEEETRPIGRHIREDTIKIHLK
jgi:hypothetical protein